MSADSHEAAYRRQKAREDEEARLRSLSYLRTLASRVPAAYQEWNVHTVREFKAAVQVAQRVCNKARASRNEIEEATKGLERFQTAPKAA